MHFLSALLMTLATQASPSQAPDSAHVVIVATTDVHGRVLGWDYVRDAVAPAITKLGYKIGNAKRNSL